MRELSEGPAGQEEARPAAHQAAPQRWHQPRSGASLPPGPALPGVVLEPARPHTTHRLFQAFHFFNCQGGEMAKVSSSLAILCAVGLWFFLALRPSSRCQDSAPERTSSGPFVLKRFHYGAQWLDSPFPLGPLPAAGTLHGSLSHSAGDRVQRSSRGSFGLRHICSVQRQRQGSRKQKDELIHPPSLAPSLSSSLSPFLSLSFYEPGGWRGEGEASSPPSRSPTWDWIRGPPSS